MAWLLDTNAWITHLKQPGGPIEQRLSQVLPAEILLCSVVKAELWYGAHKYERKERRLMVLAALFGQFISLPFDDDAALQYGEIRHELEIQGRVIGPNDLQIAAICRARGITLVSANTNEFGRVAGLRVEDWTKP